MEMAKYSDEFILLAAGLKSMNLNALLWEGTRVSSVNRLKTFSVSTLSIPLSMHTRLQLKLRPLATNSALPLQVFTKLASTPSPTTPTVTQKLPDNQLLLADNVLLALNRAARVLIA